MGCISMSCFEYDNEMKCCQVLFVLADDPDDQWWLVVEKKEDYSYLKRSLAVNIKPIGANQMLLIKHSVVGTQEMEVLKLKKYFNWSKVNYDNAISYLVLRDLNADMEQLTRCLHVCIITTRCLHSTTMFYFCFVHRGRGIVVGSSQD